MTLWRTGSDNGGTHHPEKGNVMRTRETISHGAFMVLMVGLLATAQGTSHVAPGPSEPGPRSAQYELVQKRLARGWNTWDVHSVATQVLLPEGLAIHVGLKHNSTLNGDDYLGDVLIGRLTPGAEVVTPGPHAWDGSYTELTIEWKGHKWRIESAHAGEDGKDLVMLVTSLASPPSAQAALPPTLVFSVNFLWNQEGTVEHYAERVADYIRTESGMVYCTCAGPKSHPEREGFHLPVGAPYFAVDFTSPV